MLAEPCHRTHRRPVRAGCPTNLERARSAEYLTASDARRHIWHACLSSEFGTFSPARDNQTFVHRRLSTMRGKVLILQAYGVRPRGIMGMMRRLGPKARTPEIYRALIVTMERGGPAADLLMRIQAPADALIETFALLSRDIGKAALALLTHPAIVSEQLALFAWTLSRLETVGGFRAHEILSASHPCSRRHGGLFWSEVFQGAE